MNAPARVSQQRFDVEAVRRDFPILSRSNFGNLLVYLDNAATTQKPQSVISAVQSHYTSDNANVHRGVHFLSQLASQRYEAAREKVRHFLNAAEAEEIIFVRGTTEAINLVASSYGRANLKAGDEILITEMEHHSNIVPWQLICEQTGAMLKVAPIDDAGEIRMDRLAALLGPKTRIVAVTHVSNALGTVNPIRQIIDLAHREGAVVLVDGAQSVPHGRIDVRDLDCDFFAFSSHKLYGPTGVGVLYGKRHLLEAMPPYQTGGEMIRTVSFEQTTFNDLPHKFEAGTPNIAGVIGLGEAVDYLRRVGLAAIAEHEKVVIEHAIESLAEVPGLRFIGTPARRSGLVSFVLDGIHPHDIGTILDHEGVAVRTGHHCAQPVMERFDVPATVRASFALYNTTDEVDALVRGLRKVLEVFN